MLSNKIWPRIIHNVLRTVCQEESFACVRKMSSDVRRMFDSELKPFEGIWLTSPSGEIACAKAINRELFVPYSHSEEKKLAGHYFDCRVVGGTLFGRFERFDTGESGAVLLAASENFTLKGGWWSDADLPEIARRDITALTVSLPRMVQTVWVLMPKAKTPPWATQYFLEWPSK